MHLLSNPSKAKKFFDFISLFYDTLNPFLFNEDMRKTLLQEVEGELILDVGCGTGYTSSGLRSVGIDISEKMLQRASGVRIVADATHPPFRNETFSTIICAGSFYYLPDPILALHLFNDLLKPEGVFLSISPTLGILNPLIFVYTQNEYEEFFRQTGFVLEKAEPMRRIALFVKARKIAH
jgi:ubiquinone/menaquinone biosynthesis C-methylase UbiE